MGKHTNKLDQMILFTGLFFICLLFFVPTITNLLFMVSIPVGGWNGILALLLSGLTCWWLSEKNGKRTAAVLALGLALLCVAILLSLTIYDWTYDGNTYHKAMVGCLKNGWNPLKQTVDAFQKEHYPEITSISIVWSEHYPKATETWGACLYAILGNIEAGTSFNILGTMAIMFLCYGYLVEYRCWNRSLCAVCALLLSINPTVVAQSFSYYNDGFLWTILEIFFLALIYLITEPSENYRKVSYFLVFATIGIGLNVKFSALAYFGLLGVSLFLYWCFRFLQKEKDPAKRRAFIVTRFCFLAASVIFAVTVLGATSYMTNIIRYHNALYILVGDGKRDIITGNVSPILLKLPRPIAVLASLFSKVSNSKTLESLDLKFPFVYDPSELAALQSVDTRIAGWGSMFSGIFLVSMGSILCKWKCLKENKTLRDILLILLACNLIWICALPAMSWARYYLAPFHIPVLAILLLRRNREKHWPSAIATFGIAVLLAINMLPICQKSLSWAKNTQEVKRDLEQFCAIVSESQVIVDSTNPKNTGGEYFAILELASDNIIYRDVPDEENTHWIRFNFPIGYQVVSEP